MNPARLVFPALRWSVETGFQHEMAAARAALEWGAGGFILFGGTTDAVRDLTATLRREAGRPLLIAADLERGVGQQVRGLADLPPPLALSAIHDPALIRGAGLLTGLQARSVGINWVLAPVADLDLEPENPIVQSRAFGDDPARVSDAVADWVAGCEAAGALACAKHFPGHGRTRTDSHDVCPVVSGTREELEAMDLRPFRAAIGAGVSSIMTAHVAYPALDPSGTPATFSRPILTILRDRLRFTGLIVSDALMMEGARTEAAADALRAGVDLLLYPDDPEAVAAQLASLVEQDEKLGARVTESEARYQRVVSHLDPDRPEVEDQPGSARALFDRLLDLPLHRGEIPSLRAPVELVVIDDDLGQRYPVSSPGDEVARELGRLGVATGPGGSRVLLVLSEPRASKGRAALGGTTMERLAAVGQVDLVVVFGHPRIAEQVAGDVPILLAWHRQSAMQHAVARWIRSRVG